MRFVCQVLIEKQIIIFKFEYREVRISGIGMCLAKAVLLHR